MELGLSRLRTKTHSSQGCLRWWVHAKGCSYHRLCAKHPLVSTCSDDIALCAVLLSSHAQMGRKLVYRSEPPVLQKKQVDRDEKKEKEEEELLYFFS